MKKDKEYTLGLEVEQFVSSFALLTCKYDYGLTHEELIMLRNAAAQRWKQFDKKKFNDALMCVTCRVGDNNEAVFYRHDILKAVICGVEKRNLRSYEWD